MSQKKILFIVIGAVAIVAIVVGAIMKNRNTDASLPKVSWAEVSSKSLEETVSGSGDFVSESRTTIQSLVSGRVETIHVSDGDKVESGVILISINDDNYRNALEQARVAYETTLRQTQEQYLSLRQTYMQSEDAAIRAFDLEERTKSLFDMGSVSKENWIQTDDAKVQAEMALEAARQRVNLALDRPLDDTPPQDIVSYNNAVNSSPSVRGAILAVDAARKELGHCSIRATSKGYVTGLNINRGDAVSPQIPLLRIESLDRMIAEITIDEVDIGKISVGDPVSITSDSLIGVTLSGEVISISPVVERIGNLRAAVVKASIDRQGNTLRAGASCLVKIDVVSSVPEMVIPVTAFFSHTGALWVYQISEETAEDGRVKTVIGKTKVELGRSSLEEVVITSGLENGDRIVSGGLSGLRDGIEVDLTSEDEEE